MYALDLLLKIKFLLLPAPICSINSIFLNQRISGHQHSIQILEISTILPNRASRLQKKQVLTSTDVKSTQVEKTKTLHTKINKLIINLQVFRKYCQEFLYISCHYPESNNLENTFSRNYFSQNWQIEDSESKTIEETLKQDLLNGKIKVLYPRHLGVIDSREFSRSIIKYIWRKGISRLLSIRFHNLYYNQWPTLLLNRFQNRFLQILKEQKFPVFIVVNGFNQIIVNQPEHSVNIKEQFGDWLLNQLFKTLLCKEEFALPLREAYIFINPIDAMEYYAYIKSQYPKSSQKLRLKLFVGNLDEFYKTNRLFIPHTQFRLLPDLKEIGKLVNKYQYNNNISFDKKQIYGKDYFQGQPIYLVKPVICKSNTSSLDQFKQHYFPNLSDLTPKEYHFIFTTYQDAVSIWQKYRHKFPQYSLCKKPKLKVYNMESFLQENENQVLTNKIASPKFRFVPSQETYKYLKQLQKNTRMNHPSIVGIKKPIILSIQVWINRILWGMLRRNPPD